MLTITDRQMRALRQEVLQNDCMRLARHILVLYSDSRSMFSEAERIAFARVVIEKGTRLGIRGRHDLQQLLGLMMSPVGFDFDRDPLHRPIQDTLARRDGLFVHQTIRAEACRDYQKRYTEALAASSKHRLRALASEVKRLFEHCRETGRLDLQRLNAAIDGTMARKMATLA